jgi:trigger factor
MQVEVQTTGTLERRVTVRVPAQRVENEIATRLQSLSKRARVNGFRPGKVPLKVVRQTFGGQVRDEAVAELLRSTLNEALAQQQLNPAGGPRIDGLKADEGADLEYTATFEVYPEVKLADFSKITIKQPVAEVEDADVLRMLDNLRKQRGTFKAVARKAAAGDRITIDFEGTLDGQPFPGNAGNDVPVVIGSGRMIPGFEDALIGRQAGDEHGFDVTFPHDYPTTQLAGRPAHFTIKVKEVAEQELPPLDDALAAGFGVKEGGLAQLKTEVRNNMLRELAETIRRKLKEQVLQGLLDTNALDLPKALVDEEIERLKQDALQRMGLMDKARQMDLPRDLFVEQAERRVKLGLLVGEVLRKEQVRIDAAKVDVMLDRLAEDQQDPAGAKRAWRQDQNVMRQVETIVLEEQAVDTVLAKASKVDEKSSFAELMKFGAEE